MTTERTTSAPSLSAESPASRAIQITFAALLGVVVLGGVGFSHVSAAHNATHDVRHANAFPCH
ncbi:CbtB domain-containing protein [Ancylobacter gelatini]|uniref:CbtB domain-containing protein n=1 Tax=Ancylobacter TaxID=99 RepID=UPI001F4EC807|nr:CbtB domain-containing protein [Ancylobacter gelatini]MCJ8141960.1 CbtB-domain containing protein [Ancylobacter gelatini]